MFLNLQKRDTIVIVVSLILYILLIVAQAYESRIVRSLYHQNGEIIRLRTRYECMSQDPTEFQSIYEAFRKLIDQNSYLEILLQLDSYEPGDIILTDISRKKIEITRDNLYDLLEASTDKLEQSMNMIIMQSNFFAFISIMYTIIIIKIIIDRRAEVRENEKIRAVSTHYMNALEDYKGFVSAELHDKVIQNLVLLKMIHEGPRLSDKIEQSIGILTGTISQVRNVLNQTHSSDIAKFGLNGGIEMLCSEYEAKSELQISFDHIPEERYNLSNQQKTHILRIVQEAIMNTIKHAHATRVDVRIRESADKLMVHIDDDGHGFESPKRRNKDSYGIFLMSERTAVLQGEISIKSGKTTGTHVELQIPNQKTNGETHGNIYRSG